MFMNTIKPLLLIIIIIFSSQHLLSQDKKEAGKFFLGLRSTASLFTDAKSPGTGIGGQFRIRLAKRINTEWFADYLTTNIQSLGYRRDGHIGWSVLFYLTKEPLHVKKLSPFVIAGHCFDYTKVYVLSDKSTKDRWSSAVQMGVGTHYSPYERFDVSLTAQYMNHLGNDLHTQINNDRGVNYLSIEKHAAVGLEGHVLITLSLNYNLRKL